MSVSSGSTVDQPSHQQWSRCGGGMGRKGHWSPVNTAAMVLGFIFFWPVGLFMLYWIASGRNVQELPQAIRHQWSNFSGFWNDSSSETRTSENVVFNTYQNTQYDRIREIKEEIRARAKRFSDFRADVKRRADEEEFNQFMSNAPERDQ